MSLPVPDLEEERRLCYVAITRAQKILYLMDSEGMSQQGIKKLPSRFIWEIGEKNYQRIGRISDELERESWAYIRRLNLEMIDTLPPPAENNESQIIEHHIFGKGKVLSFDPKRKVYSVQFDGMNQPRSISAEYFSHNHEKTPLIENKLVLEALELPEPINSAVKVNDQKKDVLTIEKPKVTNTEHETKDETSEYKKLPPNEEDFTAGEELPPDLQNISEELREKLANSSNNWDDPSFPKTGWVCTRLTDLGSPRGICQMCGFQIIRYVHHMYHPETGRQLNCGCVCAGKLEGDLSKARKREAALKNKLKRKINFKKKQWRRSAKGHEFLKIKNHLIVIFHFKDTNKWKFALDNSFSKTAYNSRNDCIEAIFNTLEELFYGKI